MFGINQEFASLIPPLSDDEYSRLERSILAEGVREPVITWNGVIVDGHNRNKICTEHGLECPHAEHSFSSVDAAKIWIIENQFGRRNLSRYDRGVLALQLEPLYAAEAKRRQQSAGGDHGNQYTGGKKAVSQKSDEVPIRTDEQIAALAGMSRDTIRKVKVIESEAEKGNETATGTPRTGRTNCRPRGRLCRMSWLDASVSSRCSARISVSVEQVFTSSCLGCRLLGGRVPRLRHPCTETTTFQT